MQKKTHEDQKKKTKNQKSKEFISIDFSGSKRRMKSLPFWDEEALAKESTLKEVELLLVTVAQVCFY